MRLGVNMKLQKKIKSIDALTIEVSYFSLIPFIICLIFLIAPGLLFFQRLSILTFILPLVFIPLSAVFIYFLTAKVLINFDKSSNSLVIYQRRILNSSVTSYKLDDLSDIKVVTNKAVKPPATKSIEFSFKNNPPWKTTGTNLSSKEIDTVEREIAEIKKFLI